MKSLSLAASKDNLPQALSKIVAFEPSIVFVFGAPTIFGDPACFEKIQKALVGIPQIGCSTAGEIVNEGAFNDAVAFLAIHFEKASVRTANLPLPKSEESYLVGQQIAESLKAPGLKAVFILGPGTNIDGNALVEGLSGRLSSDILIVGGLAADGMTFKKTYTFCDGAVFTERVVAVGFYGDAVILSCGAEGGWRPFGPARCVTKVKGNVVYEIDGKPALQLYKQYLGEKARGLPASGLSYPFSVLREDRTVSGIIRSVLAVDYENNALILAGSLPSENTASEKYVCFMYTDTGALTQGAAQAAAEALRTHVGPEENGCALIVDCVGRRAVYGLDPEEEIEAITDSFLPDTPIAGFYSYGEIATHVGKKRRVFHNQTVAIMYITEQGTVP